MNLHCEPYALDVEPDYYLDVKCEDESVFTSSDMEQLLNAEMSRKIERATMNNLFNAIDSIKPDCFSDSDILNHDKSFLASPCFAYDLFTNKYIEYKILTKKHPWIYDLYLNGSGIDSASKLVPFLREINNLFDNNELEDCDSMLHYIAPEHMSELTLVSLLRITYRKNSDLKSWSTLKELVQSELSNRGRDAVTMLRGLL